MNIRQIAFALAYPLAVAATGAIAFVMALYVSFVLFGFTGDTPYPCRNTVVFYLLFSAAVAPLSGIPTFWLGFVATRSRRLATAPVVVPTAFLGIAVLIDVLACKELAPWPRLDAPILSITGALGLASAAIVWWRGWRRLAEAPWAETFPKN